MDYPGKYALTKPASLQPARHVVLEVQIFELTGLFLHFPFSKFRYFYTIIQRGAATNPENRFLQKQKEILHIDGIGEKIE